MWRPSRLFVHCAGNLVDAAERFRSPECQQLALARWAASLVPRRLGFGGRDGRSWPSMPPPHTAVKDSPTRRATATAPQCSPLCRSPAVFCACGAGSTAVRRRTECGQCSQGQAQYDQRDRQRVEHGWCQSRALVYGLMKAPAIHLFPAIFCSAPARIGPVDRAGAPLARFPEMERSVDDTAEPKQTRYEDARCDERAHGIKRERRSGMRAATSSTRPSPACRNNWTARRDWGGSPSATQVCKQS